MENNNKIDKIWDSIKRRKRIPLESLRLYARFTNQIQEDIAKTNEALEYLHEAKEFSHDNMASYSASGEGVIMISADEINYGNIIQYNAGFAQLAGFSLQELKFTPISALIPEIYRDSHKEAFDKIIKLMHAEKQELNTHKRVFLQDRSRYLIPIIIMIVEMPNYMNGYKCMAVISRDKELIQYDLVHILVDTNSNITGVTSNASLFLGINCDSTASKKLKINNLIPDIERVEKIVPFNVSIKCLTESSSLPNLRNFEACWKEIKSRENLIGYMVQLRFIPEEILQKMVFDKVPPNVEFKYSSKFNSYYLDKFDGGFRKMSSEYSDYKITASDNKLTDNESQTAENTRNSVNLAGNIVKGNGFYKQVVEYILKNSKIPASDPMFDEFKNKIDYGYQVAVLRLDSEGCISTVQDKFIPILKLAERDEFFVQDTERRPSTERNAESEKIIKNTLKSKSYLYKMISSMPLPKAFNSLIYISLFLMLVSFGITIAEKFILDAVFDKVYTSIDSVYLQFDIVSQALEISTWLLQAIGIQQYFFKNK